MYDPTTTGPSPFTTDYLHQFAAITGTAPGGSGNYGIEYGTGGAINLPSGTSPVSFEVTNTTYSYLAMTLGDGFATAFTTGSYFELKIYRMVGLEWRRHPGRQRDRLLPGELHLGELSPGRRLDPRQPQLTRRGAKPYLRLRLVRRG